MYGGYSSQHVCSRCKQPIASPWGKDTRMGMHDRCWVEDYNEKREDIEASVDQIPDELEEALLHAMTYERDKVFPEGSLDFVQLGFRMKVNHEKAKQVFSDCVEKGLIRRRAFITEDGDIAFSVAPNILVEKRNDEVVRPVIAAPIVVRIYKRLKGLYPHVFPEQNPVVFLNFEEIKSRLTAQQRDWFFKLRFDFVCYDRDFRPVRAVEYHGKHHFEEGYNDKAKREFKRYVCKVAGIRFTEVNSPEELREKLPRQKRQV